MSCSLDIRPRAMVSFPCLAKRCGHTSQNIQLMRDVHECTLLYLTVALRNPGRKALCVQVWLRAKGGVHGVNDEVEKIGLIGSVTVGASKHHPVGAASSEHFHTGGPEMSKEMSPGTTVPGRFASNQAAIHRLVIADLNGRIELSIDLRLEDRGTVKGDGAVQEPARPQQGEERRQRRGHIHQVEQGLRNEQIPDPLALLAGDETKQVDGLCFHADVLPRPLHMELCLTVLLHLQTLRRGP